MYLRENIYIHIIKTIIQQCIIPFVKGLNLKKSGENVLTELLGTEKKDLPENEKTARPETVKTDLHETVRTDPRGEIGGTVNGRHPRRATRSTSTGTGWPRNSSGGPFPTLVPWSTSPWSRIKSELLFWCTFFFL